MDFCKLNTTVLALAQEIQQISAPTGREYQRARFVEKQFNKLDLENVCIDSIGNVVGYLKGGEAKPLVISAHLDTVHDLDSPLPLTMDETKIFGPGIGDNSLGVAALIGLAHYLKESNIQTPGGIWFIANVGEEGLGNLRGMIEIVNKLGDKALAFLVLEGLGLGHVIHRGLGVKRYRINLTTSGGHSWEDYGTPSAIHELARLINAIVDIPLPAKPRTTLNVGTVQGGTTVNSIAAQASLQLDLRSESQDVLLDIARKIETITGSFTDKEIHTEIFNIGDRPSGSIPSTHPLVMLAADTLNMLGVPASTGIASTDSNIPLSKGFPSICIGLTHGGKMHTLDEFIETGFVSTGLQQLINIVSRAWDYLESN